MVDFFRIIAGIRGFFVDLVPHGTGRSRRLQQIANDGRMMKSKGLLVLALAIASAVTGRAQGAASATGQAPELSEGTQAWGSNLGFEPVGPGDLVYISVTGSPELSRSSRVTADGKLMLPLLREGVPVYGLTPARIAQAVSAALVKGKVLVDPIVSASVLEYRSRRVSVVGAVRMPANFQAIGEMRLLDAIARAQGFSADAGPEVIVSFPKGKDGERTPLHVPIRALLGAKEASLNIVLRGGEEIRVPEAQKLFIVGNVKMPGAYPLADLDGSTVLKALALSQGSLPFSAKRAYIYRLIADSGKREEICVELRQILHRKEPDVALQANDILYIPDNPKTRLTAGALDRMTGFGSSVASGLIVWH
jgi:polysaccharide export outer membrane protein